MTDDQSIAGIEARPGISIPYKTIFEQFEAAAQRAPANAFLCYPATASRDYYPEGLEQSYGDAYAIVMDLADRYRAAGYGIGHRIALVAGNRPEHFWHLFALNSLGTCVVTLNQDYLPHEMAYGISFPDCAAVLTAPPWLSKVQDVVSAFDHPIPVIDISALPKSLPKPGRAAATVSDEPIERPALVIYTSGTTGRPKGCIISNESCLASAESYTSAGGLLALEPGKERLYIPLPAFHMNVSVYTLNSLTRLANCLVMQDRFSASRWWSDLAETRATCFHYLGIIPPLLVKMAPGPFDRAHVCKYGQGAGVDPLVREQFEERFGVPLVEAWGMTETSRSIQNCALPRTLDPRAFGHARFPWEVRIVDEEDNPLPPDVPGELLVRAQGPDPRAGFFSGYLNMPEETEKAWRGGWFHTGDICRQRADGMLFFVDRRKNIIRRSGENISAAEVEEAMQVLPQVKGVAALAVEDDLHDEEVMACVVLMPGEEAGAKTAAALLKGAGTHLAIAKLPAWIAFVDSLPVTSTQKLQKGRIFAEGQDPRTDPRTVDLREAKRSMRQRELASG